MKRLRLTLAVCACVVLALPAAASAKPGNRSFNATYPYASRLCARVTNGHTPPRLVDSVPQVAAACAALKLSFVAAQNAYTTAVAPIRAHAVELITTLRATCRTSRMLHNHTCKPARIATRAQLILLRAQVRVLALQYHAAVDAARKTFWATIHALRGASTLQSDKHVGPGPVTSLPSITAVAQG